VGILSEHKESDGGAEGARWTRCGPRRRTAGSIKVGTTWSDAAHFAGSADTSGRERGGCWLIGDEDVNAIERTSEATTAGWAIESERNVEAPEGLSGRFRVCDQGKACGVGRALPQAPSGLRAGKRQGGRSFKVSAGKSGNQEIDQLFFRNCERAHIFAHSRCQG